PSRSGYGTPGLGIGSRPMPVTVGSRTVARNASMPLTPRPLPVLCPRSAGAPSVPAYRTDRGWRGGSGSHPRPEHVQRAVRVDLHVELRADRGEDPPVRVDHERRALVEHGAEALHAEAGGDHAVRVRQQRVPEVVLLVELRLALDRVGRDPDPLRPDLGELRAEVPEVARLLRAAGGHRLR